MNTPDYFFLWRFCLLLFFLLWFAIFFLFFFLPQGISLSFVIKK